MKTIRLLLNIVLSFIVHFPTAACKSQEENCLLLVEEPARSTPLIIFTGVVEIKIVWIILPRTGYYSPWFGGTTVVEHDQVFVIKVEDTQKIVATFGLHVGRVLLEHGEIVIGNLVLTHGQELLAR